MKKHPDSHHAIASGLNRKLREVPIIGGKDKGDPLNTRESRTKARKKANEEVTTNAISTGNIDTYDPLLSARPLDRRFVKMLQRLGPDTRANKAVRQRIIMAWERLHGPAGMAADQAGTSGDA